MNPVGQLAEGLVAQWLQQQGWQILDRRWQCRWGELDLVASAIEGRVRSLHFVEVKARSAGNWDADGQLAVNRSKQTKLWQAAELFLSEHTDLAQLPCSFDVAIVRCRSLPRSPVSGSQSPLQHEPLQHELQLFSGVVKLGEAVAIGAYKLTLQDYISGAFDQPY